MSISPNTRSDLLQTRPSNTNTASVPATVNARQRPVLTPLVISDDTPMLNNILRRTYTPELNQDNASTAFIEEGYESGIDDDNYREDEMSRHSTYSRGNPSWRGTSFSDYKGIPLHHKFPKSSLAKLLSWMSHTQKNNLINELGLPPSSGTNAVLRLVSNLIMGVTDDGSIVAPDSRSDDPHHTGKYLEKPISSDGEMSPRTHKYHSLDALYSNIHDTYKDSGKPDNFQISDNESDQIIQLLKTAEVVHFKLNGNRDLDPSYKTQWFKSDSGTYSLGMSTVTHPSEISEGDITQFHDYSNEKNEKNSAAGRSLAFLQKKEQLESMTKLQKKIFRAAISSGDSTEEAFYKAQDF